ncbi:MAG: hypothetical protein WCG92_05375 [Hyphomicrobiales bacterium]
MPVPYLDIQEDVLALDAKELKKLRRIVALAENLIASSPKPKRGRPALPKGNEKKRASGKRVRRTGRELAQFRQMLKAERKKGVSVSQLARQHGISTAYIYMLP